MKKLYTEGRLFCRRNLLWLVVSVLCMVMAYGFFATNYTYHIDQLVVDYYDGTLLITAGRFTAPIIHFFTNWMSFSPFWHTLVMCVILFVAALAWSAVFFRASGGALSDHSRFTFVVTFVTFPVIAYQLTYPLLNIAFAYLLVPVALWLLMDQENEVRKQRWFNRAFSVLCMVFATDCYESFAGVFLIGMFAILLIEYLFVDSKQSFGSMCKRVAFACSILLCAIVLDFLISKMICFSVSGSFHFWYGANTSIYWRELGVLDSAIWLVRTLLSYYVIGHVQNAGVFLIFLTMWIGLLLCSLLSFRRKKPLVLLLYVGMVCALFSLSIVLGIGVDLHMMQGGAIFAPIVFMLVWHYCGRVNYTRALSAGLLCLLCVVQTQSINRYAVENYERHQYEAALLQHMAISLEGYPIHQKPTAIVVSGVFELPRVLTDRQPTHPVVRGYRSVWFRVCDTVLSDRFFENMSGWYNTEITNTEELVLAMSRVTNANKRSFVDHSANASMVTFEIYEAMKRSGVSLTPCTSEQYEQAQASISEDLFENGERYCIKEQQDMIVVYIAGEKNEK